MVSGVFMTGTEAELTDATVQSYEQQIQDVEDAMQRAKDELQEIWEKQYDTWLAIAKLDEIIAYTEDLKTLAEQQLDSITEQVAQTRSELARIQGLIEKQETAFLDRMVQNYMEDDVDYLQLLFGSEDLVEFMTRWDRVNSILEYDRDIITQLKRNKAEAELLESKLVEAEANQVARVDQYVEVIKENQDAYDKKMEVMSSLYKDENNAQSTVAYYQQLNEELNAQLEEYLAELQRRSQSLYVGGVGGWPLEPGAYYYVSSEQGERILWGQYDYHLGIDLACAEGTNIYAYNAGTVVISTWHSSYGNYVVIDHGGGISTLYAHMRESVVTVGEWVQQGQLVGFVGLTGNTSGYHLHFEYRIDGVVQNPRNYLYFP